MLKVSASPHVRHKDSTAGIMRDVCIALVPAIVAAAILFGTSAIGVITVTVASCILFEYLSRRLMKQEQTIGDWSAVVTGILLAFNLPPTIPLWICVVGAFLAIVVIKQWFGGLGQNFLNPALGARVILSISFPAEMTHFVMRPINSRSADLISRATPLRFAGMNPDVLSAPTATADGAFEPYNYLDMFMGLKPGTIGEVCILALLIGVIYLLARRVIDLYTPLAFIASALVFVGLNGQDLLYHLLSGGLILGAFYMANDYTTSPMRPSGQIIYGIGCGLLTGLFRVFGAASEGVSFAILLMNILTPHIDHLTVYRPYKRKQMAKIKAAEAAAAAKAEAPAKSDAKAK
ncbi:MAG: RnfABCDGE type electron transport complex subunit D [Eubacteriales bacterium]|nr:RnfABCDGE type electron transport complex subunit D [Eubacteriales bacterium]